MTRSWNPRGESATSRARRTTPLAALRAGAAALARRQSARNGQPTEPASGNGPPAEPTPGDASWTTARIVAANLAVLFGLGAIVVLVSSVLEHVSVQVFLVIFALLTMSLVRRGSRLRARGLDRIGRSITAWAGVTGSLVVVSGALALDLTRFVPELIAVSASWLLVLGVWKDLSVLVTGAVLLVGPIVWGAFIWDRSLVGAVLLVVAAGAYARSGAVHRGLFGALVVAGILVLAATIHQFLHPPGANAFDGADLLALMVVLVCLVAAGELESWREDWLAYGAVVRSVTATAALVLAALVARPGAVESWAAATPARALSWVTVAGIVVMTVLWVTVMRRSVRPGGRLKITTWTLVVVLLLGALTHAYDLGVLRWVAVAALEVWGLRALRNGLRRARAWPVVGGFAVMFGAALPIIAPRQGLIPLVLLLLAVAAASSVVVMLNRSVEEPPVSAAAERDVRRSWAGTTGVR